MSSPTPRTRPPNAAVTRVLRFVTVGAVLTWSVVVALVIAHQPEPGAASLPDLALSCQEALNEGDADALARLFGPPLGSDADAVAESVVAGTAEGRGRWTVVAVSDAAGAALLVGDDTGPRVRWRAADDDGRWLADPVAAPGTG